MMFDLPLIIEENKDESGIVGSTPIAPTLEVPKAMSKRRSSFNLKKAKLVSEVKILKPEDLGLPKLVDHEQFHDSVELMALLHDEVLVYTTKVKKPIAYGILQNRTLAITHKNVYNIHEKTVRSTVKVENLLGMSKAM